MVLNFEETASALRELTRTGHLTAWNHRHDTLHDNADVWIIVFNEGNDPRVVEWSQARTERWLRDYFRSEALLGSL